MESNKIVIREVRVDEDAAALLDIYAPYVRETAISFEYQVPSLSEFKERIASVVKKFPYIVAEVDGEIAGYAYVTPFHNRAAYEWSVETSIYIDINKRKCGIGSRLYSTLEDILKKQNVLNMYACIAYPNPGSIAFHEYMGFKTIGHFTNCGYKLDKWYDMIWMEKFIGDHEQNPKNVVPYSVVKREESL